MTRTFSNSALLVHTVQGQAHARAESKLSISVYNALQLLIDLSIKVVRAPTTLVTLLRVPEFAHLSPRDSI